MAKRHRALSGARWGRVRRYVLDRDNRECRACGKLLGYAEIDHIIPMDHEPDRDPYDPDNLQTLCLSCHRLKTAHDTGTYDPERERWQMRMVASAPGGSCGKP